MEVYVYNEAGEVVGTAFTDTNGKFSFKKLNPDENYYFCTIFVKFVLKSVYSV